MIWWTQESEDLSRATGAGDATEDFISNLSRISQLTGVNKYHRLSHNADHLLGFSDPIYAEAYVKVHGFDILLGKSVWGFLIIATNTLADVLLVNQTANTLQNLCLDFATLGDLKLVERPSTYTVAPHSFQSIKATIKVCISSQYPFSNHP